MTRRLHVLISGVAAGFLEQDRQTTFAYTSDYLDRARPTPLSLSMPLRPERYRQAQVLPWLDGLLPDRLGVRERWGREFGISPRNPFALLASMGRDCPGAVQICRPEDLDEVASDRDELAPLTQSDLGARLRMLRDDANAWTVSGERWSLGGAQAKFAVVEINGQWYEARGGAATTHIIKPGVSGFAAQGLNEHITMTAARSLRVPTAMTRYMEFDGQPAIVVNRYDRIIQEDRPEITIRVHQEDLRQALAYPPAKKYETDGGPSASLISDLLQGQADEPSHWRFVEAVAFNYLVGASDAHAKNYSILLSGSQVRLAPLYDLASSLPYDPSNDQSDLHKTAMAIDGERRFGAVTRKNWERFARRVGVDIERLSKRVCDLANDLPDAIATASDSVPAGAERDELRRRLLRRIAPHTAAAAQSLS